MRTELIELTTGTRHLTDLTEEVRRFCSAYSDGLCHVFAPHATAGLALIELGSGTESDLDDAFERITPRDAHFAHCHGSPGHGADHVIPAFVSPSLVLPVQGGRPMLGTWQSVVLVDTNEDNQRRRVRLSFLGDQPE